MMARIANSLGLENDFANIGLHNPNTTDAIEVEPGLSNHLNMVFQNDLYLVIDAIESLNDCLQADHPDVYNVLHIMIAILESKSARTKMESRHRLERVIQKNPNHLNALAELENLSKNMHRINEAAGYRAQIRKILQGKSFKDIQQKALCLLEQGYAILYEESVNVEQVSKNKLTESYNMLLSESRKSEGQRKDHLKRCVYLNRQNLEQLQLAMECERESEVSIRRSTSLEMFERAKQFYPNIPKSLVWAYYEGVAWNRKYDSWKDMYSEENMKLTTLKAMECLWKVSTYQGSDKNLRLYKSRSLALIAHIIVQRKDYLKDEGSGFSISKPDSIFHVYLREPIKAVESAFNFHSSDIFILNRYGRVLMNLAFRSPHFSEKRKFLYKAEQILSRSIEIKPRLNWFAYTTRMSVCKELAETYIRSDPKKALHFLHFAAGDGHQCFIARGTPKTLCPLAEICQYIAKFPKIHRPGYKFVNQQSKTYIVNALHYLHFALEQSGPTNYNVAFRLGSVLYDLNELKSAIEWMKRAMYLSSSSKSYACKLVCAYLVERYTQEAGHLTSTVYLLKDILFTLSNELRKTGDVDHIFKHMYQHQSESLLLILNNIFKIPRLVDSSKIEILSKLLMYSSSANLDVNCASRFIEYNEKLKELELADSSEPDFNEVVETDSNIPALPQRSKEFGEYEYDFFVSHSHKDSDWVSSKLVIDLESKLTEGDVVLRGCIADRDFLPGKTIFKNILESIKNSSKVILVITENFTESYWCQYETDQALIDSLNLRRDSVVPLLLEDCSIPDKLQQYTYANFTEDSEYVSQIIRLKRALLMP